MVKLKRGLRKEFEDFAVEIRRELGLVPASPLSPRRLAAYLEIPIIGISELPSASTIKSEMLFNATKKFFGCVIPLGPARKGILHNDWVNQFRQNSDIAHEVAHIILGHPLQPPDFDGETHLHDPVLEHEAREFSMALLVSKYSALECVENRRTLAENADLYAVSKQLLSYRIRIRNSRSWASNRLKLHRALGEHSARHSSSK